MTTITRLYDRYAHAQSVIAELKRQGIQESQMSVIANRGSVSVDVETSGAATGAAAGSALGGGVGLLTGLGILAIPGVGPVVAAGWLAATLVGVVAGTVSGGIIGALTDIGHSSDDAELYAEGLRRGGTLVTVRADTIQDAVVETVMDRANPVDTETRRSEYRDGGWKGYDATAAPHTRPRPEGERARGADGTL